MLRNSLYTDGSYQCFTILFIGQLPDFLAHITRLLRIENKAV